MENFKLAFDSVSPIFLMMLLGYGIKRIGLADNHSFDVINRLIFKVFLPVLLFYNIYKTQEGTIFNIKYIIFTVTGVLLIFAIGLATVGYITRDNRKKGVILQGFFRSNFAILGLTLVENICGESSGGLASVTAAVIIPLFNILAVIALEGYRQGKIDIRSLVIGILKNPLVIGCCIGMVFLASDIVLPTFTEKAVSDISKIASPLAMVALGGGFTFSSLKGYRREILITTVVRLVIVPALMIFAAVMSGFRQEALVCIMVAFGAPVAVSSFTMSQQMGGDGELAAHLVVISSAACLFTLFCWIFILNYLNLI